jgi:competence protein ComEA
MDLSKREKIGLISFLIIIISVTSVIYFSSRKKDNIEVVNKEESSGLQNTEDVKDIEVYISGEVKSPSVYKLKEGDRILKLVELAGGFTDKADTSQINLALKLKDEDFIVVPQKQAAAGSAGSAAASSPQNNKININTANGAELEKLPRIGPALSQRIIEYRDKNGPFKDIKDIKKVSGIGDKMFENMKDKITVH